MEDLRLIQGMEKREGYAGIVGGILTIVVGGAMLLAGVFASAAVGGAIPRNDFTATQNTTYDAINGNIFDALEVGGVVVIFVGIGLLIMGVRSLGA